LKEYIGFTLHDIAKVMHYKTTIVVNVVAVNRQIHAGALPYTQYKQIIPIHDGFIYVEEVIKRPILSKDNKIIGLLASANDITNYLDPLYLFSHYQQYHPTKEAIRHFLRYTKIQHFFYALPTKRELETLLIMRRSNATKYIAKEMQLSDKTIAENKARLKDKLKLITLNELVTKLRIRNDI